VGENIYWIKIQSNLNEIKNKPDVVIVFTDPESTLNIAEDAAKLGIKAVIWTTGLDNNQLSKLKELSKNIPIVYSPNMSIWINLLLEVLRSISNVLYSKGFDIEIVEMHHRYKKDSPSGTALKLAEVIKSQTWISKIIYGREGIDLNGRTKDEMAVFALRGGGVVGQHSVIFASDEEIIEISHNALDRAVFAKWALEAAKWIVDKSKGFYSMKDVLFGKN